MMGFEQAQSPVYTKGNRLNVVSLHSSTQTISQAATITFQQDGTLLHFLGHINGVCSALFHGRWIGSGGSVLWPPRGPDLTVLGYFFWSYVKSYVHMGKI
jgi:hypothetical protein